MGVTMQQIAERAGVSRGTVDRVLNHRGRVKPEVEKQVSEIAQELGYHIKHGNVEEKQKGFTLGVVTQLANRGFMVGIHHGIEEASRELSSGKVKIILRDSNSVDADEQLALIDSLLEEGINGLAIMPVEDSRICDKLNAITKELGIPVVTFNTDVMGTERRCFVGMDNMQAGRTAAGLMGMLTKGAGSVLIITGYFSNNTNNARVAGFTEEVRKSFPGIAITGVHGCFDNPEEVERIAELSLKLEGNINGVLIVSGGQEGLFKTYDRLGYNEKNRPYTIVFDKIPVNEKALSLGKADFLIDQNGYMQGYQAMMHLRDILETGNAPEHEYYYTDIIIRNRYNLTRGQL